ncbi:hypothetical protein HHI36_005351 [Cryptolaemus montrouzieri]|uniref:Uncharacterized protein n=1 Tax=Cryptolaemus montrouzieri TaxID=559131 RepID=A0ABD2NTV3_9CUCU
MTQDGYNGGEKLPSHLIVPCIRFVVSRRFHLLGSLFFHEEYLRTKPDKFGRDMSDCIKLYILALQNINLRVIATVSPLTAVFHRAIEILTQVPYMEHFDGILMYNVGRNKEIIHIHDPKYVRDGFLRWFMLYDLQFSLNGKFFLASRYDITDVLDINNRPPLLQKSTSNALYYHQISHYYFNEHISISIRRLIKQGYLDSQAIGTSIFINMFRQLFHRIYGLNDEDCEIFDFDRMNEYIEFIKSIQAVPYRYIREDLSSREKAAASSTTSEQKSRPNRELNALERFVKETPSTYSGLYAQAEKPLESIRQEDMYEPIMITTASGKTFIPVDAAPLPSPARNSKSKNKKKNKRDRKRQQRIAEVSLEKGQPNEEANTKSDLLLLYQNPSRDPPDNGEFLLCTPEKFEEIQSLSRNPIVSWDHNYCMSSASEDLCTKQMKQKSVSTAKTAEMENNPSQLDESVPSLERSKLEKNLFDHILRKEKRKNADSKTTQNLNLNENIRKYKNVNKTNLGAVRKIELEDELNKENITKCLMPTIPDNIVNTTLKKMQDLNLDDEIKEISYSISDPDDSTEYQFEQICGVDSRTPTTEGPYNYSSEQLEDTSICENEIYDKESIEMLVQSYLSKDQLKNMMNEDPTTQKFDSFVQYLQNRSSQYNAILTDTKVETDPSKTNYVKISMKDNDKVDIERVSADSVKPPPVDLFGVSSHDWILPKNNELNIKHSNAPTVIERYKETSEVKTKAVDDSMRRLVHFQDSEHSKTGKQLLGSTKNFLKIGSDGIEKIDTEIYYDPLEINKNVETTKVERLTLDSSGNSSNELSPNNSKKLSSTDYRIIREAQHEKQQTMFGEASNIEEASSIDLLSLEIAESLISDLSESCDRDLYQKADMFASDILAVADEELGATCIQLNEASSSGYEPQNIQIPKECDRMIAPKMQNKRYYSSQSACSSDTDGDFDIIDRLNKRRDSLVTDSQKEVKYGTFPSEQSDKCLLSDFNSEYDDFDDMTINKNVKMIISKLEEKDEEIEKVREKLDAVDKKVSALTNKEHTSKRGYIKKEIYPKGGDSRTGAMKRTIFHRDKTEEPTPTPTNVIKNSENSCDKSKLAATKASYNETLGVKSKKQLARIREEQYKKVANTISQTIKRFSDIFNLPDSDEEKSNRISQASLNFVYDLKRVNENTDLKRKQELLDDSYDRLCLSILGKNAKNPKIQHKMKELMPILQEIASSKQTQDSLCEEILSQHVSKTISSSSESQKRPSKPRDNYVREDVQNLWINNIKGIVRLFKHLGSEKIYFELTPELFKTDHVDHIMLYIQTNGPRVESFPLDERYLPIDLPECFDTLKPHGSTILIDG